MVVEEAGILTDSWRNSNMAAKLNIKHKSKNAEHFGQLE